MSASFAPLPEISERAAAEPRSFTQPKPEETARTSFEARDAPTAHSHTPSAAPSRNAESENRATDAEDRGGGKRPHRGQGSLTSATLSPSQLRLHQQAEERDVVPQLKRIQILGDLDFSETKEIGKGTYSSVVTAIDSASNRRVALKVIEKTKQRVDQLDRARFEAKLIIEVFDHPNIVKGYALQETSELLILPMELAEGDLLTEVNRRGGFPEDEARAIFTNIVDGLSHAHAKNVLHGDIKLDNVIYYSPAETNARTKRFALCDWGFATYFTGEARKVTFGSLYYASPEAVTGTGVLSPAIDVWGLGVILYAIVCATLPFKGKEIRAEIAAVRFDFPTDCQLSLECRDLILKILRRDPAERLTIDQIRTHSWYTAASYLSGDPTRLPPVVGYSFAESQIIGEGGEAIVVSAIQIQSGKRVAVKIVGKIARPARRVERARLEARLISQVLDHPNIVKGYPPVENDQILAIPMEIAELPAGSEADRGDLLDYVNRFHGFPEVEAREIFQQVFAALAYAHGKGIVHADVKLDNVLVFPGRPPRYALCDWSHAHFATDPPCRRGTKEYGAPEVLSGGGNVSQGPELVARVTSGLMRPIQDSERPVSADCQDMIMGLLCVDPKSRFTVDQVRSHRWLYPSRVATPSPPPPPPSPALPTHEDGRETLDLAEAVLHLSMGPAKPIESSVRVAMRAELTHEQVSAEADPPLCVAITPAAAKAPRISAAPQVSKSLIPPTAVVIAVGIMLVATLLVARLR